MKQKKLLHDLEAEPDHRKEYKSPVFGVHRKGGMAMRCPHAQQYISNMHSGKQ